MHFEKYTRSVPGIAGGAQVCPKRYVSCVAARSRKSASEDRTEEAADEGRRDDARPWVHGRRGKEGGRGK